MSQRRRLFGQTCSWSTPSPGNGPPCGRATSSLLGGCRGGISACRATCLLRRSSPRRPSMQASCRSSSDPCHSFPLNAGRTSSSSYARASDKRRCPFTARCAAASLRGHGSEPPASAASDVALRRPILTCSTGSLFSRWFLIRSSVTRRRKMLFRRNATPEGDEPERGFRRKPTLQGADRETW
jgi:hypothetical protein